MNLDDGAKMDLEAFQDALRQMNSHLKTFENLSEEEVGIYARDLKALVKAGSILSATILHILVTEAAKKVRPS